MSGPWRPDPRFRYDFPQLPLPERCARDDHDWHRDVCRRCGTKRVAVRTAANAR